MEETSRRFFCFPNVNVWFRSCPICASIFPTKSGFCKNCYGELSELLSLPDVGFNPENDFPHFYLFPWSTETEKLVKPTLYSLKGGQWKEGFGVLAEWLNMRLVTRLSYSPFGSVAPSQFVYPTRVENVSDHAEVLAKILSKSWGCPAIAVRKKVGGSQKRLPWLYRQKTHFYPQRVSSGLTVMVDDILTSGATSKAVWRALGRPERFEIWTLVYRLADY